MNFLSTDLKFNDISFFIVKNLSSVTSSLNSLTLYFSFDLCSLEKMLSRVNEIILIMIKKNNSHNKQKNIFFVR